MINFSHQKKGSTVVELVLYMGLLSIFIFILFDVFSQILSTQIRSQAISLVQTNGNFLLTKLTRDINQASSIVVPNTIDSTSSAMTLRIGTTDAVYTINGGRLQLTDILGTYNLNDSDTTITNFEVRKLGNVGGSSGVLLSFSLSSNVQDNTSIKQLDFQTFAATR